MGGSGNITRFIFVLILLFVNLSGQFYFKYSIYDIPLSEINFLYLGNIFSLLLSFLIILGAIVLYIFNRGYELREFSVFTTIMIMTISSYFIGYVLVTANYEPLNSYIMGLPSRRVYLAIVFIVNLFLHYYMLAYIWGILLGRQSSGSIKAVSGSVLAIGLTLGFAYYFISSQDYHNKNYQSLPRYDSAVVLGAAVWSNNKPSTIFEGRIKKVYNLAKQGKVRKIQLTGGNAPGEISEAQAAKNHLKSLGLTGAYITIEEATSTTSQQIEFIRENYFQNTLVKQNIVIISDDFHLARALEMSNFFNIDVSGLASDYKLSLDKLLYYRARESIALVLFWLFGI